jgi:hypothetical protein
VTTAGLALAAAARAEGTPASKKPTWDVNKPPGAARTVKLDTRTGRG